jgi:hypothetical protein
VKWLTVFTRRLYLFSKSQKQFESNRNRIFTVAGTPVKMANLMSFVTIDRKRAEARAERELARRKRDESARLTQQAQQLQEEEERLDDEADKLQELAIKKYDEMNRKLDDKIVQESLISEKQEEIKGINKMIQQFRKDCSKIQDDVTQLDQSVSKSEILSHQSKLKAHTLTIIGVGKREIGMREGHVHLEEAVRELHEARNLQEKAEEDKKLVRVNEEHRNSYRRHSMIYRLDRSEKTNELDVLKSSLLELNSQVNDSHTKHPITKRPITK